MTTNETEPLTFEQKAEEIGWIARRATELMKRSSATPGTWPSADWAEFFDRKAALLELLGKPELAENARRWAERYRTGDLS